MNLGKCRGHARCRVSTAGFRGIMCEKRLSTEQEFPKIVDSAVSQCLCNTDPVKKSLGRG